MMYQHSLPLTYFTWHRGVTRLVGGINGHQQSGNFSEWGWRGREKEEKEENVRGLMRRVGGIRGEGTHSNYRNPVGHSFTSLHLHHAHYTLTGLQSACKFNNNNNHIIFKSSQYQTLLLKSFFEPKPIMLCQDDKPEGC